MSAITVVDREGTSHALDGQVGWSLMEIIREAALPIEAACGGCCACATCHVYVDPDWVAKLPAPGPDESMMLDEAFQVQENSRLSCQLKWDPALAGLTVTLAPEF